jgi:hypothetical protein
MDYATTRKRIAAANYRHDGRGLHCARLFEVDPTFFSLIADEVRALVLDNAPSLVGDEDHVTNWTRPYGRAIQFSLLNRSGRLDDFTDDHDASSDGKRSDHLTAYPAIKRFVDAWPGALNMRINGMDPSSGLSPHEEHVVHPGRDGYKIRVRLHLPIATNPDAQMLLDGNLYHFQAGSIYFFNNGAVHAARNGGDTARFHILWDMWLTPETHALLFGRPQQDWLSAVPESSREVPVTGTMPLGDYATMGPGERLYRRLRLDRTPLTASAFQRGFNVLTHGAFQVGDRLLPLGG